MMSIVFEDLHFAYPGSDPIFRGVNCEIHPGEFLLLTGSNGSGKSTFLRLLNGLLKPSRGNITVEGMNTRETATARLAAVIAVTFQHPSDQIFASTVRGEVRYGPKNLGRSNADTLAAQALDLFGLAQYADMHPYDLPASHRRLLTIASAVAMGTPFLAFDEPSVHLSQPERLLFLRALEALRPEKRTYLIVTHDVRFFRPLCTGEIVFQDGRVHRRSGGNARPA
ncbi:MAG: hypothetical protein HBSIN02_10320 [Bacteroidia bacterium]|nr:MAG: hypothetical protein HBSIN02_10320 [Bacteroidia bacterium]